MSSREGIAQPNNASSNEDGFPQLPQHARFEVPGPPSIISSRMTDIASEDGGDREAQTSAAGQRRSTLVSEAQSRPGTARTGTTGRSPWPQAPPLRRGLSGKGKRGSISGSISGSTIGGRPVSSASRSHVPSLTSHAFFHPMNAQKLQAQRGMVSRPSTMARQVMTQDDAVDDERANNHSHNSLALNPVAHFANKLSDEGEAQPPSSRGTEITEHENYDRVTANTSPTQGHYAAGSLTESMRPLQRKAGERGLAVDIDKAYKPVGNLPTPSRTPRSFRSSFLLPSRNGSGSNREMQGGEKLESVASSPQFPQQSNAPKPAPTQEKTRAKLGHNYEYFEGNTVFCIGGRMQNTRDRPINIGTGLLVVLPCVLFFVFSAPWIWDNISPAIPITFAYLFYISISSFIHASASDPGILPRNLHRFPPPDENEDPLRLGPPTNDWALVKSSEKSAAAMEVPVKFCKTCNIWRPPRTHHCRLCDNCVETQDHHCVWLNNCIGRRNYRYFFTFVSSTTLLSLYLLGASIAQLIVYKNQQGISFGDSIDHFRVPFTMVIYGIFGFTYPAALMGYHIFLMARGETTREYLNSHKFVKQERYRPFNQGNILKNLVVVLCRPRPPTYYRFKQDYLSGDQRLGARRLAGKTDSREGMEMHVVNKTQSGFQGPVTRSSNRTESADR